MLDLMPTGLFPQLLWSCYTCIFVIFIWVNKEVSWLSIVRSLKIFVGLGEWFYFQINNFRFVADISIDQGKRLPASLKFLINRLTRLFWPEKQFLLYWRRVAWNILFHRVVVDPNHYDCTGIKIILCAGGDQFLSSRQRLTSENSVSVYNGWEMMVYLYEITWH